MLIDPPLAAPGYKSTTLRAPTRAPVHISATRTELTGPHLGLAPGSVPSVESDLTANGAIGERIIVTGRVLETDGRPVRNSLVEIWQANAAGRYRHDNDRHDAPLDPGFHGAGRCLTDGDGIYRFQTIKPGAYPWGNHPNAWRPAHIHFSLYGESFSSRLITQMYFPGDPLLDYDPIFQSVPDPVLRARLIAAFDLGVTVPDTALGYRWDIVLRGPAATPFEATPRDRS